MDEVVVHAADKQRWDEARVYFFNRTDVPNVESSSLPHSASNERHGNANDKAWHHQALLPALVHLTRMAGGGGGAGAIGGREKEGRVGEREARGREPNAKI